MTSDEKSAVTKSAAPTPPYSLRRRLLWLLGLAIIAVALLQAALAYRSALAQADAGFDAQMKQLAVAIEAGRLDAQRASSMDELDFIVQTWSADGRLVYQSRRRLVPARRKPGYSIAKTGDKTYRVFALDRRGVSVQVSQDLDARTSKARRDALSRTLPVALLGPLLVLLAGWVIRRSFVPVERVRKELANRQAGQLNPVDDTNLPGEIQPLVTELNELFGRVSRTIDTQQDFVADAAHELRSPLTALKLQLQNLRKSALSESNAETEAALNRLDHGIERAARMTDQLISMAQQQEPPADSSVAQNIDLTVMARDIIVQLNSLATDRDIDLGLYQADPLQVSGWPESLKILMRNLIDNAIKYTPPGGTVDVSVITENDFPCLVVEDSGPGIDPALRERVVDRFYRAKPVNATPTQPQGSGLGLSIVKTIAERHGGDLQLARSPRLGGLRARVQFRK